MATRAKKRARGVKPSASATSRSPTSTAEAPSVSWEELPAVTTPSPSGLKTVFRLAIFSGIYVVADALVRRELYLVTIGVETGGGQDLLVLALTGRRARPPMALGGEGVQVLARYLPLLGYAFGALALVNEVLLLQEIRVHLEARLAVTGVAEHRRPRHALRTRGDGVAYVARSHGLRGEVDRLLAGAAHAVEADRGHRHGEAREQHAEPADVRPLLASLGDGAVYDVLDLLRV